MHAPSATLRTFGIWVLVIAAHATVSAEELSTTRVLLQPGELRVAAVENVGRVAVGKSEIVDVSVISPNQLLLHAKATGTTNLILWTPHGQEVWMLDVVDRMPQTIEPQLRQLIQDLDLPHVQVRREEERLFLMGNVSTEDDLNRLEQLLVAFPPVTNLVRVQPLPPAPRAPAASVPMVSLAVQVIEMSRSDVEKLGVKWSESLGLTEPSATDLTFTDALVKWGTSLTRSSVAATLNALVQQNRARLLAEPKLVTASGKEASTFVGVEVPILQATSTGVSTSAVTVNIEFRQTGVLLKMTPTVLDGLRITTNMAAEVSKVDSSVGLTVPVGTQTILVPGFAVRKASTEVTTASGQTIVVAGLLEQDESTALNQVPALGSMPVVGRLFRSPEDKSSQRELVIAVTPELLAGPEAAAEKSAAVEQALTIAEMTPAIEDPTLRYALDVQRRIAESLQYPEDERAVGVTGEVKLRVHLLRDGTVQEVMVLKSSGFEALDRAAVDTATRLAPYPAFPAALAQRELWLELPVLFRP